MVSQREGGLLGDFNLDGICEIESERERASELVNEPGRWTNGQTDGWTDAYVAFRVYYFVGGWSREVRSAVLVADSISRVHAPLNAVVLRKEVVDFSLSLPSLCAFSLSPSLSSLLFSDIFLSRSEPLGHTVFAFLSFVEREE